MNMCENRKHDHLQRGTCVSRKIVRALIAVLAIALSVTGCGDPAATPGLASDAQQTQAPMPVVDFHNDRSFFLTARGIPWRSCANMQICAERYRAEDRAQYFFALFRPPPPYRAGRFGLSAARARRLAQMSHLEYINRAIQDIETQIGLPITRDPADLGAGSARVFLGLEGAFLLDDRRPVRSNEAAARKPVSDAQLRAMLLRLRGRGLSYVGLTWSNRNAFAGVAGQAVGLKPAGRRLVHTLRDLGLLIDLSHSADQTVRDVHAELGADYPLFFSHSSARALCDHPRNLSDDLLKIVRRTRGLVAVNFHSAYISCGAPASRADVVQHLLHLIRVAGVQSVALGGDFDGLIQLPEGLGGPADMHRLAADLLAAGVSRSDLELILYGNARRVLSYVQRLQRPDGQ